ncbi:MAG: M56 family metallopeptidase [Isosphaeraceae bacterium]
MWVRLDRFGWMLADAAVATTVMLSLVVFLLLVNRQPARRITAARPAILLATLMFLLVVSNPLPKVNPFALLPFSPSRLLEWLPESFTGPWLLRALTLGYLVVVVLGLFWLLLGFWAFARLVRTSETPRPETLALFDEAVSQSGSGLSAATLRVSRRIDRPAVANVLRPFILIPPEFEGNGADRESLRWVLVHELAHCRQSDARLSALASLAQTLWFMVPFVHWLRWQVRIDQEFLADQRAAAIAGSPAQYARRLIALAHPIPESGDSARTSVGLSDPTGFGGGGLLSPLLQRVVMLLRCPYPIEADSPRAWEIIAPLFVLLIGGACSCLSFSTPADALEPPTRAPGSFDRAFRVDYFLAAPRGVHTSGRSLPYVLPFPLPSEFEISVDVEVPRGSLRKMRLAGLLLDQPATPSAGLHQQRPTTSTEPNHHRVSLRRTLERLELTVDDVSSSPDQASQPLTEWLTVEPPADETAVLRNLVVRW